MPKSKLAAVNRKIEKSVVDGYKVIEHGVTGGFNKISDKFVDSYLTHEGESVEDAKQRLEEEQKERKGKHTRGMEARRQKQQTIMEESIKRVESYKHEIH